jgi:predicted RNase H-like HicB family nuclease
MNYIYQAVFEPDGEALKVTFPDLPTVITCGWSIEEAVAMAKGALGAYLDMCLDGNETLSTPTSGGFVSLLDVDMALPR